MTQTEPTPIEDWLADTDLMYLYAKLAVATFAIMVIGLNTPVPLWIGAGASVAWPIFAALAIANFVWRQYKQWRYPTSYEESA